MGVCMLAAEVGVGVGGLSADCWVPGSVSLPATQSGPLEHLAVAVKDMFAVEGHVSSFGHPRWRQTHAASTTTAPVVSRLLAAGASVAGLAKLDQLAYSLVGNAGEGTAPLNSRYPDRFTGGSSSGPAAAVAAGLADIGLGTDTAGSIRVPAAACGLFGWRPTPGLVDSRGVLPLAPSFDVVGVLARNAALLGEVAALLGGSAAAGRPAAARRVLVPADCLDEISPQAAQAVRAAAGVIAGDVGCELADCRLGAFVNEDVADLFARIQGREVWRAHGSWLTRSSAVLAPDVRGRVERAARLSAAPVAQQRDDERKRGRYVAELARLLSPGSVVLLPVLPGLPPLRSASAAELQAFRGRAFRLAAPASLAGRPEVVIPVRHRASGQTFGVGLLGAARGDLGLLRIAGRVGPDGQPLIV
jgi:amidase